MLWSIVGSPNIADVETDVLWNSVVLEQISMASLMHLGCHVLMCVMR